MVTKADGFPDSDACVYFSVKSLWRNFIGYEKDTDPFGAVRHGRFEFTVPINPSSPFSQGWEFFSGLLLLYTTAVTPLLISFFSEEEGWCRQAPTLKMDMFVDTFFIFEIVTHFLTGRLVHGQYVYKFREVCALYLRGTFPIDLVTAVPVAWLEYFLVEDLTCEEKAERPDHGNTAFVQYMRLVRMLRMLRLLKVLKIFNVLRDLFRLRPTIIRLLKLAFTVIMIAHIGGCAWWFIKLQEGEEELIEYKRIENIQNPIVSSYLASLYFMMATLCTVGYGDISAGTDTERVFVTFVMLMGSAVFAIIVSNMSALVASIQSGETLYMEKMDEVIDFLRSYGVPRELEMCVQSFYHFLCKQQSSYTSSSDVLNDLPAELQRQIRFELNRNLLSAIPLLDKMSEIFISDFVSRLEPCLKTPGRPSSALGITRWAFTLSFRGRCTSSRATARASRSSTSCRKGTCLERRLSSSTPLTRPTPSP